MKLTLWFLNRITQWEVDHKGELGEALAAANHDVLLGRRGISGTPTEPGTLALNVNHTQPSFRGELMHEGHQQTIDNVPNAYDEYFMPIPLKCLGKPEYDSNGNPQLTAFWKKLIRSEKQSEFLKILTPQLSENHCFKPELVDGYWAEGRRPVKGDSELAKEFSDVRMNTQPQNKIGYYQILQQAKQQHGPNILIGYSQGGAVVNYLAYIDEYFVVPEVRCIAGMISVQGALRGSTLAMSSLAAHVLNSLVEVVHALWGQRLLEFFEVPGDIRNRVDPLLAPGHQLQIVEVVDLLDALYPLAKSHKGLRQFVATARKWLSGLDHDEQLAFWDLDSVRLNHSGSVMEALDNHALMNTYCGAVAGDNFHLEPLLRSVIEFKHPKAVEIGFIVRGLLRHILHNSEVIFQTKTFDMMPEPLSQPNASLDRLHSEWLSGMASGTWSIQNGAAVPAQASDCVIPTASQMLRPVPGNRPKFLGNYINQDASHISGALLDNDGPKKDIDYVKELLGRIAGAIGDEKASAATSDK